MTEINRRVFFLMAGGMSEIQTSDKANNIRKSLLSTSWVKIPQTIFRIYGVQCRLLRF